MGFGYAAWNVGILHGNVTLLAGASYFIPVLSAFFCCIVTEYAIRSFFLVWCADGVCRFYTVLVGDKGEVINKQ